MMKKIAKSSVFAMIMLVILMSLTGCGGDKLVGKMEQDGVKSTIEISFKDDKAEKMKLTFECKTKDEAKEGAEFFKEQYKDAEVKQSGKKITINMEAVDFINSNSMFKVKKDDLTKEKMTELLEKMNYEVK